MYVKRIKVLGRRLSSEVPWNILLDLLVTEAEGRSVSVTALAHGAQAALTTTLRYVELLCEAGYIMRIVDGRDRRRSQARLTARGRTVLEELLAE